MSSQVFFLFVCFAVQMDIVAPMAVYACTDSTEDYQLPASTFQIVSNSCFLKRINRLTLHSSYSPILSNY